MVCRRLIGLFCLVFGNPHLTVTFAFVERFTCGQLTFAEAYRKTGRIFCVTLSSTTKKAPPVLLNYLTTPNVTIASAVIASAAVPGFVPPVRLQYSTSNVCLHCFNDILRRQMSNRYILSQKRILKACSDPRQVKHTLMGLLSRIFQSRD